MNVTYRREIREDDLYLGRMLFVRSIYAIKTMAAIPLIVASLLIATLAMSPQHSSASVKNLEIFAHKSNLADITYEIEVDPLEPVSTIDLFGEPYTTPVVRTLEGDLIPFETSNSTIAAQTFGLSSIVLDYHTYALISKEGRFWTFEISSPADLTLQIDGYVNFLGATKEMTSNYTKAGTTMIELKAGDRTLTYYSTSLPSPISPPETNNSTNSQIQDELYLSEEASSRETANDIITGIIIGTAVTVAISGALMIVYRSRFRIATSVQNGPDGNDEGLIDIETVSRLCPGLRDDDKQLVKFLFDNGRQAFESELRKRFLQPRTTMWRAVKRLERQGIVSIEKKDQQNLVHLNEKLEEKN